MIDPKQITVISDWLGTGAINVFGLPFAGKDDQTNRLAKLFSGPKIGSGDIFRAGITPEIKSYFDEGKLMPSDLFVQMVLPYLGQQSLQGKPLLLSSVGRWYGEENGVMQALEEAHHPLKAVIYLVVSREDALNRLRKSKDLGDRGNRDDDDEQLLLTRFEEFETKTMPVIDHYRELGLLIEIDATKSREEVQTNILDALAGRATTNNPIV
jgi:adenylate kinase